MAKAGAEREPRAEREVKAEHAAEAEEGAKAVFVARVELEAKAGRKAKVGLAVGVIAEARRRVMYGARARLGSPSHEVAVMKRAVAKTKRERGVTVAAAVLVAVTIGQGIVC